MNKRKGHDKWSGVYHAACKTCNAHLSPRGSSFQGAKFARAWLDTEAGEKAFADHVCDPEFVEVVANRIAYKKELAAKQKQNTAKLREQRLAARAAFINAPASDTPAPPVLARMLGGF